jgi:DNA-binding transcriptional MerR regulator
VSTHGVGEPVDGAAEGGPEPLSIGEVLAVLAEEFPDVTVSKIRFLESQGLVNPDRNASGYRQFDDADIERLRWILRQQRDKFLPLKVIKRALDNGVDVVDAGSDQPTLWTAVADDEVARMAREAEAESAEADSAEADSAREVGVDADDGEFGGAGASTGAERVMVEGGDLESPGAAHPSRRQPARSRHATPADVVAALQEDPRPKAKAPAPRGSAASTDGGEEPPAKPAAAHSVGSGPEGPPPSEQDTTAYDRDELLEAAGIAGDTLDALAEFGLVAPVEVGGEPSYDDADLLVCRAAARCAELGLGPRHLRIYKVAAVREAGLVEQLVMPMVKQRNPEARAEAGRTVAELTALGAEVHAALLARELGPLAPPSPLR